MWLKCSRLIFLVAFIFPVQYCLGGVFYIGAVFDRKQKLNSAILEYAINAANKNILSGSEIELKSTVELVGYGDEFMVAESVCRLLEGRNLAIVGPKSAATSAHASSICDVKEVPYIDTYMDVESKLSNVNLYPSHETLSQLLIEVLNKSEWQDITVLYEAPMWIKRIVPLLEDRNNKGIVTVQPLEVGTNFRNVLKTIKEMGSRSTNIIIECSIERLSEILEQSMQVGLFTKDRNIIITNLDAQTIDLDPYQFTEANIYIFRIINPDVPFQEYANIRDILENEKLRCDRFNECSQNDIDELSPEILQTPTALIFDAVMILAEALRQIGFDHIRPIEKINCYDAQSTWSKGYTITNFMKNSNYTGLTGPIEFDTKGKRSNIEIEWMALSWNGLKKVGSFKPTNSPQLNMVKIEDEVVDTSDLPINLMTFTVITSLSDPYAMLKDTSTGLSGNDRFEGFGIDIIDALAEMYGFKYNIILQEDKNYGSLIDDTTNTWDGMIGKVMQEQADLAITDLTINSDRINALDFTPSFMNLGIALLYRKPTQEPPSTFSFMSPFSSIVWVYLGAAYITVSLCFFCLGRISPSQWENRYPCIEEPTYLENQFTLNNSMWFAIGALLQQGSEIEPKAASIRLASSVWWFFTLIMVSSYTANLAAFLVVENKSSKISGVEDLKDCGIEGKECPVQFGAKKNGATLAFFRDSQNPIHQNMYNYMMNNTSLLTDDNDQGVERVYNGLEDYAFLMESSSIQYTTERKCNLTQVGERLDDKNYGIGMRKHFKYEHQLSEGVLRLQEKGILAELHTKWWKERKGGGACSKDADKDAEELKMANLKGVFLVLLYGSIFACFYGCIEASIIIYGNAKKAKILFKEELIAELKFLMTCQGIKEVRHRKSSSKSQNSGQSYQSNASRYSLDSNGQVHGSNRLLDLN